MFRQLASSELIRVSLIMKSVVFLSILVMLFGARHVVSERDCQNGKHVSIPSFPEGLCMCNENWKSSYNDNRYCAWSMDEPYRLFSVGACDTPCSWSVYTGSAECGNMDNLFCLFQ
jgi:hypothetical protein